ncbi:hypothetical protein [Deinococcus sp. UYEF24]
MNTRPKNREARPTFPQVGLQEALTAAFQVYSAELGTHTIDEPRFKALLGDDLSTSSLARLMGSLKIYDLSDRRRNGYALTDRAVQLFTTEDYVEFKARLHDVAVFPPLMGELSRAYGDQLDSKKLDTDLRNRQIIGKDKTTLVSVLRENERLLGHDQSSRDLFETFSAFRLRAVKPSLGAGVAAAQSWLKSQRGRTVMLSTVAVLFAGTLIYFATTRPTSLAAGDGSAAQGATASSGKPRQVTAPVPEVSLPITARPAVKGSAGSTATVSPTAADLAAIGLAVTRAAASAPAPTAPVPTVNVPTARIPTAATPTFTGATGTTPSRAAPTAPTPTTTTSPTASASAPAASTTTATAQSQSRTPAPSATGAAASGSTAVGSSSTGTAAAPASTGTGAAQTRPAAPSSSTAATPAASSPSATGPRTPSAPVPGSGAASAGTQGTKTQGAASSGTASSGTGTAGTATSATGTPATSTSDAGTSATPTPGAQASTTAASASPVSPASISPAAVQTGSDQPGYSATLTRGRELAGLFYRQQLTPLWSAFSPAAKAEWESLTAFQAYRAGGLKAFGAEKTVLVENVRQDKGINYYTRTATFAIGPSKPWTLIIGLNAQGRVVEFNIVAASVLPQADASLNR